MGLYMGRANCASGLLRGQTQPLSHSDLHVEVPSSRHRGDAFTSLNEIPFIPEVLGLVSWFCIPQPRSAGVKRPICLCLDSAAVIYTSQTSLPFIIRGITDLIWRALPGFKEQDCKTEAAFHLQCNSCTKHHPLFNLAIFYSCTTVALTEVT